MITPTVGRVVWFYRYIHGQGYKGPLAAHICKVLSDELVNLMVIDENGQTRPETSVKLLQLAEDGGPRCNYCEWMPYQKGQAAQAEALERKIK